MPRQHISPHLPQPSRVPRPNAPGPQDTLRPGGRRSTTANTYPHPLRTRWRLVGTESMARSTPQHLAQPVNRRMYCRNGMPYIGDSTSECKASRHSSRSRTHNDLPVLQRGQLFRSIEPDGVEDHSPFFGQTRSRRLSSGISAREVETAWI